MTPDDQINHPPHYNACGERDESGSVRHEPIKVIESWGHGWSFCVGCAVKYILRASHKGSERKDLEKARWYLMRCLFLSETSGIPIGEESLPVDVSVSWRLPPLLAEALSAIYEGRTEQAAALVEEYARGLESE